MREIEFRGKSLVINNWVYGNLIIDKWGDDNNKTIYGILRDREAPASLQNWIPVRVNENTIGQYTGHKDKNGTKIFEGDIVKSTYFNEPLLVEWDKEWVGFTPLFDARPIEVFPILSQTNRIEVIGNVIDNPELLGEEND